MNKKEKLIKLYQQNSKHSNYQVIPAVLKGIIPEDEINVTSRFEIERMSFLKNNIDFTGKRVLDIGGNTGFFSFESIEADASHVDYIEGNSAHANFVKEASSYLDKNIEVYNSYLDFESDLPNNSYDIVLLFNVLHHFGDDYGDKSVSVELAKAKMIDSINYFSGKTDYLVLQLGFCWKGDRNSLLFENGTKKEMIDFVSEAIKDKWKIEVVGVAEEFEEKTAYHPLTNENIIRKDALGEFRNRPIFILKPYKFEQETSR
ncbi:MULTISPECIES: class I SAM-dependent methyltransferase [Flavobacteriaceae]|uniref:Class I SAM-dependent methyltransferase n=2 Tax=Flavobacteriaceae TaxID=49546 RepID=A0A4Y8ATK8_9FLAO|nr:MULTISPECIES: class I SAM-dependent methyltransferase [Flavobacteriaceae]TEW75231.1 class I SAM-dependent methyltransferase [Gramella jeungdoensis]GGK60392.1 hypothetical protein GCM10007963_30610 [Lutibacter litoralis]